MNYEELARCTDDFNGAQCKAVCVEAVSMIFATLVNLTQVKPLNVVIACYLNVYCSVLCFRA